ncbi:MAG: LacI family DNA-binding transcriptional regulator [Defluviitaleaceae bacterium]|nr:LacI family DNA-binding transcriptional regulator [Defluviitaleaceae bacterium]
MTIRELAKIAQVSPATVSIVLNNKHGVSEETRARVMQAAYKHDYNIAKNSRKRIKDVLLLKFLGNGMLIEENQSFVATIIDSIINELKLHNHRLSMHIWKNSLDEALREVDYDNYCSAIVVGTEIPREWYEIFHKIPIPYIVVDNPVSGFCCNSVTMDNHSNVYFALEYLRKQGHKQIGYLRSSMITENIAERAEAFQRWTQLLNFDVVREAEFFLTPTLVGAYSDMRAHLENCAGLPTCLYADNDTVAIGAIKAIKEHGYKVPKDVSVVGMDDIPFSSVSSPALTTVRVQKEKIGQIAVAQLFALMSDPAHQNIKTRIAGELIVRSSVANLLS